MKKTMQIIRRGCFAVAGLGVLAFCCALTYSVGAVLFGGVWPRDSIVGKAGLLAVLIAVSVGTGATLIEWAFRGGKVDDL